MKIKVSEAEHEVLDWMVAKAKGLLDAGRVVVDFEYLAGQDPIRLNPLPDVYYTTGYKPSTNWAQGGPIIELECITLRCYTDALWDASIGRLDCVSDGPTPLIAAMRCYVAINFGDEVDVPDELV